MREIKFRGYNLESKRWVYGTYLDGYIVYNNVLEYNDYLAIDVYAEVVEESVGQYTGLKDVNGREIYEGDIVRLCCNGFHNNVEIFKGEVIFEEGSFEVKAKGEYTCLHDGAGLTTSEVIGNIYENPELLKEQTT